MRGDNAKLRRRGEQLGRERLSWRVRELVNEFHQAPTHRGAIQLAGRLQCIAVACGYDDYWREQAETGFYREMGHLFLERVGVDD